MKYEEERKQVSMKYAEQRRGNPENNCSATQLSRDSALKLQSRAEAYYLVEAVLCSAVRWTPFAGAGQRYRIPNPAYTITLQLS